MTNLSGSRGSRLLFWVAALIAMAAFSAHAAVDIDLRWLSAQVEEQAPTGTVCRVRGVITQVSALARGEAVLAPEGRPNVNGVLLEDFKVEPGVYSHGSVVSLTGEVILRERHAALRVVSVEKLRQVDRAVAYDYKPIDCRRGFLHLRFVRASGIVRDLGEETAADGRKNAILTLINPISHAQISVRIPGRKSDLMHLRDREIVCEGVLRNHYSQTGELMSAEMEVESMNDLHLAVSEKSEAPLWIACGLMGALLLLISALALRERHKRQVMKVVAEDRRRMAAELHDTIEQYLAGANLLLNTAQENLEAGRTEQLGDILSATTGVLSNAKLEVRNAVMNLRGNRGTNLREELATLADGLRKAGIKVEIEINPDMVKLDGARLADLVQIVREAATNAIRHGKCKTIRIFGKLSVANDGAPFDVVTAVGPELGHYGLTGMRERALRSGFAIAWKREGDWTVVEVKV